MAYFKPYIDETGMHLPLFQDVLDEINDNCRRIFGNDIYLETDSQDYQVNAEVADLWADVAALAQMVYNNRSIQFAKGVGVDGLLKINGLRRLDATNSTCMVTCTGMPGTRIINGYITNQEGDYMWSLENTVIPESGNVYVKATCTKPGPVYADAGTLNQIVTQTRGWESVVNGSHAIPGKAIESDSAAKARQAVSTARPSSTVIQGLTGGIAELSGVMRYRSYENDTGITDGNGIPPHSICYVVEGGDTDAIGREIYLRKTPGCGTYGNVAVNIPSPEHAGDPQPPIYFYRPTYINIFVQVNIKPRSGFVDVMADTIRKNISDFINELGIGENVAVSLLEAVAQSVAPNLYAPAFTLSPTLPIIIGTMPDSLMETDIEIAFNAAAQCDPDQIEVVIVND